MKHRKIEPTVKVTDLYTPEELQAIFKACADTRDLAMFQVLFEAGARASELLSDMRETVRKLGVGKRVNSGVSSASLCGQ